MARLVKGVLAGRAKWPEVWAQAKEHWSNGPKPANNYGESRRKRRTGPATTTASEDVA
jgi:hypothetical protein